MIILFPLTDITNTLTEKIQKTFNDFDYGVGEGFSCITPEVGDGVKKLADSLNLSKALFIRSLRILILLRLLKLVTVCRQEMIEVSF